MFQIKPLYASDSNEVLRRFNDTKFPRSNIVEKFEMGLSDRGDKFLGLDRQLDVYIAGCQCQPFGKIWLNQGKADDRPETTRDSIAFFSKRGPKMFILEQVKNMTTKAHKKCSKEKVPDKLLKIKDATKKQKRKQLYKQFQRTLDTSAFGLPNRNA